MIKNALSIKQGTHPCFTRFGMMSFALTWLTIPSLLGLVRPGSSGMGYSKRKTNSKKDKIAMSRREADTFREIIGP